MSQMNGKTELSHVPHSALHLMTHALKTEEGKALMKKAVGTAVAAAAGAPILLPILAIGAGVTAAIWWFKKC